MAEVLGELRSRNIVRQLTERAKRIDCECEDLWCFHWEEEVTKSFDAAVEKAVEEEREACALLAENPYGDEVQAYGADEPKAVGSKIAAAIRARKENQ